MKKETDSGETTEDVKDALPSLEDILTPAGWDARIAKARARREQTLTAESKPKAASKKTSKPKKQSAKAKGETTADGSPSIKEILATGNWTDRLEKAKAHRDQVFAERAQSGEAPDKQIPGKMPVLYKDTIRVAVSGDQTEPALEKTKEKKIGAAAFPAIAPVAAEPKRRMGAIYVAAGIVLALGIGWIAPSPFGGSTRSVDGGAPVAGGTTSVDETAVAAVTQPVVEAPAVNAEPILLAQPIVHDRGGEILEFGNVVELSITANAPLALDGIDPSVLVVAAMSVPMTETMPVIRTEPYVAVLNMAAVTPVETSAPATPVLEAAPEFQAAVGALSQIGSGANAIEIAMRQTPSNSPVRATPTSPATGTQGEVASRIAPLPSGSKAVGAFSDVVLLTASIEASSSTFQSTFAAPAGVEIIALGNEADPGIQPTNIRFLSGPVITEIPLIPSLPATQLAVLPGSQSFVLSDATSIRAAPDVLLPVPTAAPVRLASLGSIPLSALQQEPTIAPEQPESFESLSIRLASLSPDAVETEPGFPGADNFSIHLHAPTSLADNKLGAFASALRSTGFSVKDPKRVSFTIRNNNVRFFHPGDEAAARVLASAIDAKARDFTDYSPSPPVGTIEVWLAGETPPASSQRPTRRPSGQDPALTELRNRLLLSLRRGDHL